MEPENLRTLTYRLGASVLLAFALSGCGGGTSASPTTAKDTPSRPASASRYDAGPRAGEQPIDEALAAAGTKLFQDKGCSACHAFGRRLSGPDLAGVTLRRTASWMENQILHPDVMTKEDPISRELMGVYALQMPNQGLTQDEARSVIEFLKQRDHESAEGAEASEGHSKEGDRR